MSRSNRWIPDRAAGRSWSRWSRPALPLVVVVGAAVPRRREHRLARDVARGRGRRAVDRARRRRRRGRHRDGHAGRAPSASSAAICCSPSTTARSRTSPTSWTCCTASGAATTLRYTVLRLGTREVIDVRLAPIPGGPGVALLRARGGRHLHAARRRRGPAAAPARSGDAALLLAAVAFFGVFTFSFSGRLDRLDWVFYWADAISILALPPLFLHFTLVFPERPRRWTARRRGPRARGWSPTRRRSCSGSRASSPSRAARATRRSFVRIIDALDRIEFLYLAVVLHRRPGRPDARAVAGAARSRRGGSCAGSPGARRSAPGRSRSATRCRTRSASSRRCRCSCRRFRSA